MEEFNNLAKQIEKLNINLTPKQIQEIIEDENEMNGMIEKIKELDLNVIDQDNNYEITVILKRLSELTITTDQDEGEFDIADDYDGNDYKYNWNINGNGNENV